MYIPLYGGYQGGRKRPYHILLFIIKEKINNLQYIAPYYLRVHLFRLRTICMYVLTNIHVYTPLSRLTGSPGWKKTT